MFNRRRREQGWTWVTCCPSGTWATVYRQNVPESRSLQWLKAAEANLDVVPGMQGGILLDDLRTLTERLPMLFTRCPTITDFMFGRQKYLLAFFHASLPFSFMLRVLLASEPKMAARHKRRGLHTPDLSFCANDSHGSWIVTVLARNVEF